MDRARGYHSQHSVGTRPAARRHNRATVMGSVAPRIQSRRTCRSRAWRRRASTVGRIDIRSMTSGRRRTPAGSRKRGGRRGVRTPSAILDSEAQQRGEIVHQQRAPRRVGDTANRAAPGTPPFGVAVDARQIESAPLGSRHSVFNWDCASPLRVSSIGRIAAGPDLGVAAPTALFSESRYDALPHAPTHAGRGLPTDQFRHRCGNPSAGRARTPVTS